ncbi:hypothetical protein ACFL2V_18160 [Pseudomonadota bacterium]
MKYTNSKTNTGQLMALTLCAALIAPAVHAEQEKQGNVQGFLSDPHRVGSLTGTILGGALTAHPAGAIAGSIIGFFIGKQSMFDKTKEQELARFNYKKRAVIPANPETSEHHMLAFNEPGASFSLSDTSDGIQLSTFSSQTQPDQLSALQQVAAYCYGSNSRQNNFDPQLQAMCYYHQSSG